MDSQDKYHKQDNEDNFMFEIVKYGFEVRCFDERYLNKLNGP